MGNRSSSSSGGAAGSSSSGSSGGARHRLLRVAAPEAAAAALPAGDTTGAAGQQGPPARGLSSSRSVRWLRPMGSSGRRLSAAASAAAAAAAAAPDDGGCDGDAATPLHTGAGAGGNMGNGSTSTSTSTRTMNTGGSSSNSSGGGSVSGFLRSRFASSGGGGARGVEREERSGVVRGSEASASGSGGNTAATSGAGVGATASHGGRFRAAFGGSSAGGVSRRTRVAGQASRPPAGGTPQTRCPRCSATLLIPAGRGGFRCPCGVNFSRADTAPATVTATGATTTATTPVSSHNSSTSSSPEVVVGQRRQRLYRRAEPHSPTPRSTLTATIASSTGTAAALASASTPAHSNHWSSPTGVSGILAEGRGGHGGGGASGSAETSDAPPAITGDGGLSSLLSAPAPGYVTAARSGEVDTGMLTTRWTSRLGTLGSPETSDASPASTGDGGVSSRVSRLVPDYVLAARVRVVDSEAMAARWTSRLASAADGALGMSSSIRSGGRGGGVNDLQVVMCSNCGRAGVIHSLDSSMSRSMFFCSCGNPVIPATPAQLLAALSRGAAAAATQHRGASDQLINLLPTMKFEEDSLKTLSADMGKGLSQDDDKVSCRVCLCDYEGGDTLRILPCLHKFHQSCIDQWLARSPLCPLCNTSVDVVYTDPLHGWTAHAGAELARASSALAPR